MDIYTKMSLQEGRFCLWNGRTSRLLGKLSEYYAYYAVFRKKRKQNNGNKFDFTKRRLWPEENHGQTGICAHFAFFAENPGESRKKKGLYRFLDKFFTLFEKKRRFCSWFYSITFSIIELVRWPLFFSNSLTDAFAPKLWLRASADNTGHGIAVPGPEGSFRAAVLFRVFSREDAMRLCVCNV